MLSIKALAVLAVAAGLVVAPTATAGSNPNPVAGVSGGDVAPLAFPAVVNVPFVRTRAALAHAVDYADTANGDSATLAKAVASLTVVRNQLKKAWAGEKYLIDNAPPPAPPGDFAFVSGAPVSTSPFASAEDSGAELFNVYDEVATMAVGLSDTAKGTVQTALSTTIFAVLNQRDAAIKYIHDHQPPPPPGDVVLADASGAPVASGWSGVMPTVSDLLDDEIQQLDAMLDIKTLSSGARKIFNAAELQDTKTKRTITTWWPPLPPGD